jgi:hypothetical protein
MGFNTAFKGLIDHGIQKEPKLSSGDEGMFKRRILNGFHP